MRAWFPGLRSIAEILAAVSLAVFCFVTPAKADERLWADLQSGGHVLLMRHAATNPGVGDPPQFRLDDCTTQRNLSAAGQMQAANIGRMLMAQGVTISTVLSSRWCRCLETARRAFGKATPFPALDSFFGDRSAQADAQTTAVRAKIQSFNGPGNLMMVTHQVNITALTGEFPAEGEIFVVRAGPQNRLQWVGRLPVVKP
jgi:phosphohistidine phosphatase SixA